ncbi:UDP-3-O-(3-hydroxymyristoyl)glucosamine N-acyltransferase [Campylobacter geochelonis]|uniref:UDP-3-O-(3-hydroxymyristoyl)glucosamine N-acyltransferase n=1 Tax=Campylobacter geochelonis TaxID=1780362 RepID=UPI000770961A|nr:UDP-3-O-(3-hydroxymyristoyl)glucosamine N-acyltransferase [Campylobacter geochelonis]CZE48068.1 UDP-3-O-[3-hydroxymyristoyl] glucosamine N-acyltransferase [Campylobacter geochelonis]CZE51071.1 UDP-3-O-[3-hydroxymyristoyl] glucosamine N-acyltransferase [Campylobacter geochelonis]
MKLSEIAKILDVKFDGKDVEIVALNSLKAASSLELSYCDGVKHANLLKESKAGVIIVTKDVQNLAPKDSQILVHENPHLAFAILSQKFAKKLIDEDLAFPSVDALATVMSHAYVGLGSVVAKNTIVMAGAYIGENVKVGENCIIYPNAVIYNDTIIGDRCIIHANAVIGSDGFGFAHTKTGEHVKIYHNGNVVIEDDVEIGACSTVDRGVFGSTIIKKGTKIDNLVQIGHNCELGENCLIVSQTGIAGSSTLGRNVVMGGQSGTTGHLKVGDFAQVAARGGVTKNIAGGKAYGGRPAVELKQWLKTQAKIERFFRDK